MVEGGAFTCPQHCSRWEHKNPMENIGGGGGAGGGLKVCCAA